MNSFILHIDSLEVLEHMTDKQAGQLFKAIKQLQEGQEPNVDFGILMALAPFKNQFKRDREKYDKTVERNRVNGLKGGRPKNQGEPKKPNGLNENQGEPKKPYNKSKNKSKSKNVSNKEKEVGSQPFEGALNEFKLHRKQIKKPFTELAEAKLRSKLSGFPEQVAIQMIDQSIENGWAGVFEIKGSTEKTKLNTKKMNYGSY